MSKKAKYYVITEEGVEGSGQDTPLKALVEYIEFSDIDVARIDEIVQGRSEINGVQAFTKAELDALPED